MPDRSFEAISHDTRTVALTAERATCCPPFYAKLNASVQQRGGAVAQPRAFVPAALHSSCVRSIQCNWGSTGGKINPGHRSKSEFDRHLLRAGRSSRRITVVFLASQLCASVTQSPLLTNKDLPHFKRGVDTLEMPLHKGGTKPLTSCAATEFECAGIFLQLEHLRNRALNGAYQCL